MVEFNTTSLNPMCYVLNNLSKEKTQCTNLHQDMAKRALSFTTVSQKLLFDGETREFHRSIFNN